MKTETTIDMPGGGRWRISIGEQRVISANQAGDPGGWVRIHPHGYRLPNGRLVVTVSRDHDIADFECLVMTSTDEGLTWEETLNWPGADRRGDHPGVHLVTLGGESLLGLYSYGLFATGEPDVYRLPTWRSGDSGDTWGELEPAVVRLPGGVPMDLYDPPQWYRDAYPNYDRFRKPSPPPAVQRLIEHFGPKRLVAQITSTVVLDPDHLLAFLYFTSPAQPGVHQSYCIASTDGGRTWEHRSTPGAWESRLATENFMTHHADGLCETYAARRPDGSLLLAMRLGSRHPLYWSVSTDEGRTWSSPMAMPVWGILPNLVSLPDGVMALSTGRPDVSLSFSFDGGYRWPWTYRFLEDGKPEDGSTRNNSLVRVGERRLLYLYDSGYHGDKSAPGSARVVGHFVDIEPC